MVKYIGKVVLGEDMYHIKDIEARANLIDKSEKGAASGVATLDASGKVPSSLLPSYVDDVLEYESSAEFPVTGESSKIYVAKDTNISYRWSGSSYIVISNPYTPDEEDLTVTSNVIKFKDRPNTDGMGRVILRKNIVSGVNTLTQSMINQANTIYVIQYDFTLGENITIPADCVLEFDGGSISGTGTNKNTITGAKTKIVANSYCLKVILAGTFTNGSIDIEWFGIKSGSSYVSYNDSIIQNYVIPSMENVKSILYMSPNVEMAFSTPIVFNGDYGLDLKGTLNYTGADVSTAITIGKSAEATTYGNYYIHQLVGKREYVSNHDSEIIENVGICLLNIAQSNITIDSILHFCYCLRLKSTSAGCASNEINVLTISGYYYYGVHLLSTENGWTNENKFYCKKISAFSSNPVVDNEFAIWFDSENTHPCNGNIFIGLDIEANTNGCKYTNARYNVLFAARLEKVTNSMVVADNNNRVSGFNTIFANYATDNSLLGDFGTNNVVSLSGLDDTDILLWSDILKKSEGTYYKGVCLNTNTVSVPDPDNPDTTMIMRANTLGTIVNMDSPNAVIGRIVRPINIDENVSATLTIKMSDAARIGIVVLRDDLKGPLIEQIEDPDNPGSTLTVPVDIRDYVDSSTVFSSISRIDDYTWRKQQNGLWITGSSRKNVVLNLKKDTFYFIGVLSSTNYGIPKSAAYYSDNLYVANIYEVVNKHSIRIEGKDNTNFIYMEGFTDGAIKYSDIYLNTGLHMNNTVLDLSNSNINVGNLKANVIRSGTLNIAGSFILPNYNKLINALNANAQITGMPAAGTLYWQNGKPTWSNGTAWVDATGTPV